MRAYNLLGLTLALTACTTVLPVDKLRSGSVAEIHDGVTWLKIGQPRTLADAEESCQFYGGNLAEPTDAELPIASRLAGFDWTWLGPVSSTSGRTLVPHGERLVEADGEQPFLCTVHGPTASAPVLLAFDWTHDEVADAMFSQFDQSPTQAAAALSETTMTTEEIMNLLLDLHPLSIPEVLTILHDVFGLTMLEAATTTAGLADDAFLVTELALAEGVRTVFDSNEAQTMVMLYEVFDMLVEDVASMLFHDFLVPCEGIEALVQLAHPYGLDADSTHTLLMSPFVACTPRDLIIRDGDDIIRRFQPAIERYAPILMIDADERFHPEPIEVFLGANNVMLCPSASCENVDNTQVVPVSVTGEGHLICDLGADDAGKACSYPLPSTNDSNLLKDSLGRILDDIYLQFPQFKACVNAWDDDEARYTCRGESFEEILWYQAKDGAHHAVMAEGTPGTTTTYVHLNRFEDEGITDIQYWIFYGYNGPGTARVSPRVTPWEQVEFDEMGTHDADWEVVHVRVDDNQQLVDHNTMFLSGHGNHKAYDREDIRFAPNSEHPLVFPSRNGHANEIDVGDHPDQLFCLDVGVEMDVTVDCDCSSECEDVCEWIPNWLGVVVEVCEEVCATSCDVAGQVCSGITDFDIDVGVEIRGDSLNIASDDGERVHLGDSYEIVAIDTIILDDDMGLTQYGEPVRSSWFGFPGAYAPQNLATVTHDDVFEMLALDQIYFSTIVEGCIHETRFLDRLPLVNRDVRSAACRATLSPVNFVASIILDEGAFLDDITEAAGMREEGRPAPPMVKTRPFRAGPFFGSFTESNDQADPPPECLPARLRL